MIISLYHWVNKFPQAKFDLMHTIIDFIEDKKHKLAPQMNTSIEHIVLLQLFNIDWLLCLYVNQNHW